MPGEGGPSPIDFTPPAAWQAVTLSPPDLGASDVSFDSWSAWGPPEGTGRAVSACLGVDVGTWTEEATPFALERLTATMSSVASTLAGVGTFRVSTSAHAGDVTTRALLGDGEAQGKLAARTFLGFLRARGSSRVEGCFVLCAPTTPSCELSLAAVTPTAAFVGPPDTSLALRAVVHGVHHPFGVALGGLAVLAFAAVVAIWTRPRPRTK